MPLGPACWHGNEAKNKGPVDALARIEQEQPHLFFFLSFSFPALPLARQPLNLALDGPSFPLCIPDRIRTASVLVVIIANLAPLADLDTDDRPAVPMMLQIERLLLGAMDRGTAAGSEHIERRFLRGSGGRRGRSRSRSRRRGRSRPEEVWRPEIVDDETLCEHGRR